MQEVLKEIDEQIKERFSLSISVIKFDVLPVMVPYRYFMQLYESIYFYTYNFVIAKLFLEDGKAWIAIIDHFFYIQNSFFKFQQYRNLSVFFS